MFFSHNFQRLEKSVKDKKENNLTEHLALNKFKIHIWFILQYLFRTKKSIFFLFYLKNIYNIYKIFDFKYLNNFK